MTQLEGRKDDAEKVRLDLVPPELVFSVGEILTFGAKKYTETELSKFWNCVGATRLSLYTPKVSVVHVTRETSGLVTLSSQSVNEQTGELGNLETLKKSKTWLDVDNLIPKQGRETSLQKEEMLLKNMALITKITSKDWDEVVKFAEQQNTSTLITTTQQGNSEVYFAASTTMAWDSLVTTLKVLKPHLPISSLEPKTGDRNWEKGMKWGRVYGALMRHLWAWWRGEKADPETGMSHLWHAGCCIAFLITYEQRGIGEDDRNIV